MEELRITITQPNLLLVEGRDEELLFAALLRHEGLQAVQLLSFEGKNQLPRFLKALVVSPEFASVRSIGIERDVDTDAAGAFQSVCGALGRVGMPVPERPLVPAAGPPKVTVMILPGASRPGALEDLCLAAVSYDAAFPCVERYFDCLVEAGVEGPRNASRARVQVFLASRPEAGKRLGEAAHYLPWSAPAFDELREFVQTVSG